VKAPARIAFLLSFVFFTISIFATVSRAQDWDPVTDEEKALKTDPLSPAAGAIADQNTIVRAGRLNLDAQDFLERSDSFGFFEPLNDLVVTGPTGTNVRDLRVLLKSSI